MKIQLKDQERHSGILEPETLKVAVEQVKTNGYIVFEEALPAEQITKLREAFDPLFEEHISRRGYNTGKNRAQMFLPFTLPYADENIINNPLAMSVIDQIVGEDNRCIYFASDTPMPGADYQNVHCDVLPLFKELSVPLPCYALVMNIPLVDVTELNAPLEVWPGGTHMNPDWANHDTLDGSVNPHLHIVRAAEGMLSEKVLMKAGSIVIRDLRMWHRGTPNLSDDRRTNLAFIYSKKWYGEGAQIHIPQETYDGLSEKSQQLFRFEKIGFPVRMPWEW